MTDLLDDLVSLNGIGSKNLTGTVDLSEAARQAIRNLDQAINESGATVEVGHLPVVRGLESHSVQLFQNLIGNAIKYRGESHAHIRITAQRAGREWVVKIKDNGIGIAPEYHDVIFGIFKRLDHHDIPGTGIGLAVCKKIVDRMDGRIWVESEPGCGSTFCFALPVLEEEETAVA